MFYKIVEFAGSYITNLLLSLVELFGTERFAKSYGFILVAIAFGTVISLPFVGMYDMVVSMDTSSGGDRH